jgi:hypothetical protein
LCHSFESKKIVFYQSKFLALTRWMTYSKAIILIQLKSI